MNEYADLIAAEGAIAYWPLNDVDPEMERHQRARAALVREAKRVLPRDSHWHHVALLGAGRRSGALYIDGQLAWRRWWWRLPRLLPRAGTVVAWHRIDADLRADSAGYDQPLTPERIRQHYENG